MKHGKAGRAPPTSFAATCCHLDSNAPVHSNRTHNSRTVPRFHVVNKEEAMRLFLKVFFKRNTAVCCARARAGVSFEASPAAAI